MSGSAPMRSTCCARLAALSSSTAGVNRARYAGRPASRRVADLSAKRGRRRGDADLAGVSRRDALRPLDAAGFLEPLQILPEPAAHVPRTALAQHRPQWIDTRRRAHHLAAMPLLEVRERARRKLRLLRREIASLMRIAPEIEQHHVRKSMIAIVIGADADVIAEPHGALCGPRALR